MKLSLQKLVRDTRGAGFAEYIILTGLVALLCIIAYESFGTAIETKVGEQAAEILGV